MTNILDTLQRIKNKNSSITSISIINLQQYLQQHHYALLPAEYISFLYDYNGINYDGGVLCGIHTQNNLQDISNINKSITHPLHQDLVFIGYDDLDYLAYNQHHNVYQIIDKSDLEVLEEYSDFSSAAQHILKIPND